MVGGWHDWTPKQQRISVACAAAFVVVLIVIASSTSDDGSSTANPTTQALPSFSLSADPPATSVPTNDDTEVTSPLAKYHLPPWSDLTTGACDSAMRSAVAAGGADLEATDSHITKTLTACRDLSDWLGGVVKYPEAMGLSSDELQGTRQAAENLSSTLQIVCSLETKKRVCAGAQSMGALS